MHSRLKPKLFLGKPSGWRSTFSMASRSERCHILVYGDLATNGGAWKSKLYPEPTSRTRSRRKKPFRSSPGLTLQSHDWVEITAEEARLILAAGL